MPCRSKRARARQELCLLFPLCIRSLNPEGRKSTWTTSHDKPSFSSPSISIHTVQSITYWPAMLLRPTQRRFNRLFPNWSFPMLKPWVCSLQSITSNGSFRMDELWVCTFHFRPPPHPPSTLLASWLRPLCRMRRRKGRVLGSELTETQYTDSFFLCVVVFRSHHPLRLVLLGRLPSFQIDKKRFRPHWSSRCLSVLSLSLASSLDSRVGVGKTTQTHKHGVKLYKARNPSISNQSNQSLAIIDIPSS